MQGAGKMEEFVYKDKKRLRCGYTTGTCAALAARAAVQYLVTGRWPEESEIVTPKGTVVRATVLERSFDGTTAECAVKKDAGDDYDVTDGILIFAQASFVSAEGIHVFIDGGAGVGRVTKAGLDQPVGAAAINSVPRKMITAAVTEVFEECGRSGQVKITIHVPEGERAAAKTFNPVLGITGGISILGTSGIVEPMSEEALVETIHAHLKVLRSEGKNYVVAVPGNMGAGFMRQFIKNMPPEPGMNREEIPVDLVTCSNFIGKTIELAGELGFSGLVIGGHLGKLVKLGNGIMNTHSKEGDGRMDTLVSCGLTAGAGIDSLRRIQAANTTEEAVNILREEGILEETMAVLCERIDRYVKRRAMDSLKTGVILFDAEGCVLGSTEDAFWILKEALKEEAEV